MQVYRNSSCFKVQIYLPFASKLMDVGNVLSKHKFWTDDIGVQLQNLKIPFSCSYTTGGVLDFIKF